MSMEQMVPETSMRSGHSEVNADGCKQMLYDPNGVASRAP